MREGDEKKVAGRDPGCVACGQVRHARVQAGSLPHKVIDLDQILLAATTAEFFCRRLGRL